MSYLRVIPRDFFNESKLLKCLGKLLINSKTIGEEITIKFKEPAEPFNIELNESWAILVVTNYKITVNGFTYTFGTTYNSKDNYPLVMLDEYEEINVLNEDGTINGEFLTHFK